MNGYEGMFLIDATLAAKEWNKASGIVTGIIAKHGGELKSSCKWGDRKLTFDVRGHKRATYFLAYFTAPEANIDKMRKELQLAEAILRHQILQRDGTLPLAVPAQPDEPRGDRDRGPRMGGGGGGRFGGRGRT